MTIALIAGTPQVNHGSTSPQNSSPDCDTSAANFLLGITAVYQGATDTYTDNKTNSWTALTSQVGNNGRGRIWYAKNPASVGSGHHGICASTAPVAITLGFAAFSGVDTTAPIDGQAQRAVAAAFGSAGAIIPSVDGELVIVMVDVEVNNSAVPTLPAGYTALASVATDGATFYGFYAAYKILGAGTAGVSIDPGWTTLPGGTNSLFIASFKPGVAVASFIPPGLDGQRGFPRSRAFTEM